MSASNLPMVIPSKKAWNHGRIIGQKRPLLPKGGVNLKRNTVDQSRLLQLPVRKRSARSISLRDWRSGSRAGYSRKNAGRRAKGKINPVCATAVLDNFIYRHRNTPSHHRVHHGADDKYLDKNYAGILIIWDRMFGTFQVEEETPRYGLKRDFESQHPIHVLFSELPQLWCDLKAARSGREVLMRLFARPGWEPK